MLLQADACTTHHNSQQLNLLFCPLQTVAGAADVHLKLPQLDNDGLKSYWREWVRECAKKRCQLLCILHLLHLSRQPGSLDALAIGAAILAAGGRQKRLQCWTLSCAGPSLSSLLLCMTSSTARPALAYAWGGVCTEATQQ